MDTDFTVWEAMLYAFLNSFPYMLLVLFSFRKRFRFSVGVTSLLLAAATVSQVTLNTFRFFSPQVQNPVFDIIIAAIYVGFIFLAIKERFGKLLFTVQWTWETLLSSPQSALRGSFFRRRLCSDTTLHTRLL